MNERTATLSPHDQLGYTIIVPIDIDARPYDIVKKALRLARFSVNTGCNLVFGYNDRNKLFDFIFKRLIMRFTNVQLATTSSASGVVNLSELRNIAVNIAKTEILILLDVDIWPDQAIFEKYVNIVRQETQPFSILPCIYLTENGTSNLIRAKTNPSSLFLRYLSYSRSEFLHIAIPSSITVVKKTDYLLVGGFDTSFVNHGYEDFDFLMRLGLHHGSIYPAHDILVKSDARSPLFSRGFKRYLGRLCIDPVFCGDVLFHLHHAKPSKGSYYDDRPSNLLLFLARHKQLELQLNEPSLALNKGYLFEDFVKACSDRGIELEKFSVLFDNKPGHIDRYNSFKKRLRFLLHG
jgi:predicted glycosyltransferase involved in capsule biosynthesis